MKQATTRILIAAGAILALFLIANPLYIVNEGEQVVVTRFGEIVDSTDEAGLHVRLPFADSVIT